MVSQPCQIVATGAKPSSLEDSVPLCACGTGIWTVCQDFRHVRKNEGQDLAERQEIVATLARAASWTQGGRAVPRVAWKVDLGRMAQ
jgi:hypothetical protein